MWSAATTAALVVEITLRVCVDEGDLGIQHEMSRIKTWSLQLRDGPCSFLGTHPGNPETGRPHPGILTPVPVSRTSSVLKHI